MDGTKIQKIWNIGNNLAVASQTPFDGPVPEVQKLPADEHIRDYIQRTELEDIEQIILSHESVEKAVAVLRHGEEDQDDEIVAFITIRKLGTETRANMTDQSEEDDEKLRVQFWDGYWDGCTYPAMDDLELSSIGRDFLGWTSMYDGKEIDKAEMNEWLDETIATIQNICSEQIHVLEIGTGSGMILFNLINGVRSYVGLEMSQTAVEFVNKTIKSMPDLENRIHMYQGTAADLSSMDIPLSPNLVVINSVVQYFPTQDYLLDVIENLLRIPTVQTLFFGDIRSYALYDEFLVSKALRDVGGEASKDKLQKQMAALAQKELELLIDPAFFTALPDRFTGIIKKVDIHPKRMKAINELSCYRYAAIVYLKDRGQVSQQHHIREIEDNEWIDFKNDCLDRGLLLRLLDSSQGVVAVSNIPNQKIIFETHVVDSLRGDARTDALESDDWLSSVRQRAQSCPSLCAQDLQDLAQHAGYHVELSWARQKSQRGGLDAIFHKYERSKGESQDLFRFPTDYEGRESKTLSTQPLEIQAKQTLREQLNESLHSELPVHLLPRQINIIESIPMKENGEVDHYTLAGVM